MMKIHDLREIIQFVNQSSFQDFEFEHGETKLLIKRGEFTPSTNEKKGNSIDDLTITQISTIDSLQQQEEALAFESVVNVKETIQENHLHKIVSPMVGTFYAAPEPVADAFVRIGDKVTADKAICIVEAMKLYNEIEAGLNGEIVEILVEDGQFVDFGQALFLVKPE